MKLENDSITAYTLNVTTPDVEGDSFTNIVFIEQDDELIRYLMQYTPTIEWKNAVIEGGRYPGYEGAVSFIDDSGEAFSSLENYPTNPISTIIELSHLGYENLTIRRDKIKDTIFLVPTPTVLNEIIVSSKKQHTEFIKPNKKARFVGSFLLSPKTEILSVLYPNGKYTDAYIEKIHVPITKKFPFEIKSKTTEAVLRVNIYKVVDSLPAEQLYSSTPIKISGHSKDEISIDLSDENITINNNGLCIGLEMIGFYDNYQEVKPENAFIRAVLTNKENKAFSAKTYLRFLFEEKDIYHTLNDLLDKGSEEFNVSKHFNHNLSLGFDLTLN